MTISRTLPLFLLTLTHCALRRRCADVFQLSASKAYCYSCLFFFRVGCNEKEGKSLRCVRPIKWFKKLYVIFSCIYVTAFSFV